MQKINILAPVALTEKVKGDSPWRECVNLHARLRFRFMLKSLLNGFDPAVLETLLIVAPDRDRSAIDREIAEVTEARRVSVVSESVFFERCGLDRAVLARLSGWQIQQILKLGFAEDLRDQLLPHARQRHRADSPRGARRSVSGRPRAVAGVETASDYQRLYSADFASQELDVKKRYYEVSQYPWGISAPPREQSGSSAKLQSS